MHPPRQARSPQRRLHSTSGARRVGSGALAAAMAFSTAATFMFAGAGAASASTTDPNPTPLELANAQLSKEAATQGMVLLENHDSVLPIAKSTNVALFGLGAFSTIKGGTGSGAVNNRYNINVRTGLENAGFAITTNNDYWTAMSGGTPAEKALTAITVQPAAATDTAIYVIPRNSGEGSDRKSTAGDYLLSAIESANIQLIGQTYKKVVVVINSGGIIDTSFFKTINASVVDPAGGQALDSLFLMSQAGEEGGNALAEVLDGDVNPSGKLTDTWASKYSYYPASATFGGNDSNSTAETYTEGIYVGYRYFDSFYGTIDPTNTAGVVNYPFGYGLSYSKFQIDTQSVTADTNKVVVKAKVTNTGTVAGKQVVQVYFSAPQTGLDKPYQELAGYAKTDTLAPGASQVVTISYDTTQMASYDTATAAYVMDAGDYVIRVGDSSRNTHVAKKINLASNLVTEQLANELDGATIAGEYNSDPVNFYTYPGEAAEISAAGSLSLNTAGFVTPNHASPYEQNRTVDSTSPYFPIDGAKISSTTTYLNPAQTNWEGTGAPYAPKTGENVVNVTPVPGATLFDVAKGNVTLQQFVAGLSVTQLSNIVEGANVAGSTPTAVGAAGYTTAKYENLGIPGMALSDGPAGLRLTQKITTVTPNRYQYQTAWPIGTLLAQTWDSALVKKVGDAIGKEMLEAGVTLWLAPGQNIHRDPLNGRNFEYYSEDPLVTGLTSAATTEGVQSNPGIGVTIKHFAANNQEASRTSVNETISERTLREIYLRGFEISVKAAQPMAIMTSYNKINTSWSAQNYDLDTDVLRGEWGFKGLIMTDWGGNHNALYTMYAGNDLIEPGNNQAEIYNAFLKAPATIDYNGLPAYNRTVTPTNTAGTYTWTLGSITLSATGTTSYVTNVDSTTNLSQPAKSTVTTVDAINNQTVAPVAAYGTVANAYAALQTLLTSSSLTTAQKAAIVVSNVVYSTPGDNTTPVASYTVTVKGNLATTSPDMRLGDVQRSAINILNVVKQSMAFQQLAVINNVSGITVAPYTSQFSGLNPVVTQALGTVVSTPTLTAAAPNGSGWYTGPVSVTAAGNGQNTVEANVDGAGFTTVTAPIVLTGQGTHTIVARTTDGDGNYSSTVSWTGKIDTVAPLTGPVTDDVDATHVLLSLVASDVTSGVASTQWRAAGGTWATYTAPVGITRTNAAQTIEFRSTDVAGNVENTRTVVIPALPTVTVDSAITATASAATVAIDKTVKVTVSVTAPSGLAGDQVTLYSGDTVVGAGTLTGSATQRSAVITLAGLTGGTHQLVAKFAGNAHVNASESAPVTVQVYFTDLKPGGSFYDDVEWLATQGVTTGNANGTFTPLASISRQALIAWLWRYEHPGQTDPVATTAPFTDVPVSNVFAGDIAWAKAQGIVAAGATFNPGGNATRQDVAVFLYRALNHTTTVPTCTTAPFSDITYGSASCGAISWLKANNITTGYTDGSFKPTLPIARDAVAAWFHRASQL
ncbi:hypothetical protein D1871_11925 [Nakamurella silvestris]|nr:hypothetical protein D1871_11925 [Nakamurella silvestris]